MAHRAPHCIATLVTLALLALTTPVCAQDASAEPATPGTATTDTATTDTATTDTATTDTAATDAATTDAAASTETASDSADAATEPATTSTTSTDAAASDAGTTPPASTEPPWGAIVTFGVAGLGLVLVAVAGPLALVERERLVGACAPRCTDAQIEGARNIGIVADVGLATGLLGAVIGVVLLSTASGGGDSPEVAFVPTPEGATLTVAGRF